MPIQIGTNGKYLLPAAQLGESLGLAVLDHWFTRRIYVNRSIHCSAALLALLAVAAQAQETPAPINTDNYAADSGAVSGDCPGGYADAHGYNLNHGKHGPNHWGLAYGSGYPDGLLNYGHPPGYHDYKGPGLGCRTCANGQCMYRYYGCPDLFYNYYAWPSCTDIGAQLYISPRPVPANVGHTYITYQPLMPHEFLYTHHRTYHRYYNGGQGLNRTSVHYWHSPFPW